MCFKQIALKPWEQIFHCINCFRNSKGPVLKLSTKKFNHRPMEFNRSH